MIQILIPAMTLGFLGSFHCIGMCGPIALTLPINSGSLFHKLNHLILYNLGRTLTYSMIGLIFGSIGQTFVWFGFQQILSILIGVLILFSVFFSSGYAAKHKLTSGIYNRMAFVKKAMSDLFKRKGWQTTFSIGLLNGLLPCGLVYMGVAGAMASNSAANGAMFMAVFGLSTIPVMMSISLLGNIISIRFKQAIQSMVPYVLSVMAVLLILRGLNLGIPYISPNISNNSASAHTNEINCHK